MAHHAGSATLTGLFSVGAVLPIVILGYIPRLAMMSVRGRLLQAGRAGKVALGTAMLLIGIATISGRDRQAEAWLVNHSPAWLTNLTTRFCHHGPDFPVMTGNILYFLKICPFHGSLYDGNG
jgi:hypothetical protein